MIPVSAIIITLNEERNIERCIDSLKSVVDEILVVDSFSTDRTKEICISAGVRFIENKWMGYSAQKNFAHQQAKNDFIVSLDADEALSDELRRSILEIRSSVATGLFSFNRLTNYCGKWIRHGGWYPDIKLRLYDRRKCRWEGTIHERLIYPRDEKVILLKGDCLHYTFYTVDEHRKQVEKFTSLMAKEEFARGRRSSWFNIIFNPVVKFVRDYFFRLGFLDGKEGFLISRISAHAAYMKYTKLMKLSK
ncbi:MAG: glycosyltransferase family 2 protein [Bacteroidetes bacterium]|nr:glycosyltransferase family 2 protein [Bacteroidota bacterium]